MRQAIAVKLAHPPCKGEWWKSWLWYCDYKATRVVVELRILRDGQLLPEKPVITVRLPIQYAVPNRR